MIVEMAREIAGQSGGDVVAGGYANDII
jgi:hypothetical protein